jgi:hypothetical protein
MVPKTQLERLWMIGAGIIAFALVAVGYFFFISPQRSQTSDVDGQVSTARAQNDLLQTRISHLAAQNANLAKYEQTLTEARLALPVNTGIPDFLRTLQAIGSATGTDVSSLAVSDPASISLTAPSAGVTATPNPNAAATSAPQATTTGTGTSNSGIYAMTIAATVKGVAPALGAFLLQLQSVQPRAVLISNISETADTSKPSPTASTSAGGWTLVISMQAFVAMNSALSGSPAAGH